MPPYLISTTNQRRSRIVGLAAVAVAAVVVVGWSIGGGGSASGDIDIRLHTARIGDGVGTGTAVQLDGVQVGSVTSVSSAPNNTQLITLKLTPSRVPGLTDTLSIDYAAENLFGITSVKLRRSAGGAPLQDQQLIDLAGARAVDVRDSTMGTLLSSVGDLSTEVLTPKLSELLRQSSTSLDAFSPLMKAMVEVSRSVADVRQYPTSVLLEKYSGAIAGGGDLAVATMDLFQSIYEAPTLRYERPAFDTAADLLADGIMPQLAELGLGSREYLEPQAAVMAPMIDAVARMVPTPDRSRLQLTELLRRIDDAFVDTPSGMSVNIALTLLTPLVAQPTSLGADPFAGGAR